MLILPHPRIGSGRGRHLLVSAALGACLLAACDRSSVANTSAAELYQSRCAVCHGESGAGDGPAAAGIQPRPRDLTDPAWHAQVTAQQIARAIVEGGTAVGKSPMMPPQPDLAAHPEAVQRLVQHVRSMRGLSTK